LMFPALVIGTAVATQKHPTLDGWKLLLVQPMTEGKVPDGDPQLAIDPYDAGRSDWVLVCNEGKAARELVGEDNSPARWFVLGVMDP
ncbi:MAG: EutN/CcmL family microcompartment protein, partial [Pirellulales bacterium]|nr:EutN/CcmL family microcompartment protein [Pirellulales bacterium]